MTVQKGITPEGETMAGRGGSVAQEASHPPAGLAAIDADAFIFDPPYGIEHESNHGASWQGRQIHNDGDTAIRDAVLQRCGNRPWACFGTWKMPTPENARGVLVWDKGPASGMGDLSFPWKTSWEEIAIGGEGWRGFRDEGIVRGHNVITWESKGRCHPHQKPVSLVQDIIRKLPDVRTICDPTMGSGTTIIAAMRLGLNAIGCESDSTYFDLAVSRITAELNRCPLFKEEQPTQRSMFEEER